MNLKTIAASAAFFVFGAGIAAASSISDVTGDPTFSSFHGGGAGTYGLEVRGGDGGGRATWEIGVGSQTSNSGTFNQGQVAWDGSFTPVSFSYDYGVTVANRASVTIGTTTVSYDFTPLSLGNAISIFAKRDAQLSITNIDGHAVSYVVGDDSSNWDASDTNSSLLLFSEDFLDGFTMTGTISIRGSGNSAHEVFVTAGNVEASPVPLPAAAWMLLAGVAGLGAMARKRKSA